MECGLEEVVGCRVERDEADAFDLRRRDPDGGDRDLRGEVGREPVNAGGDGGERDTERCQVVGHLQAAPVAGGEGVCLAEVAARRRIRASRAPGTPTARQAGLVRDFKQAWEARDIAALVGLLDPDATAIGDGGGLIRAALHPIEGAEQVARAVVEVAGRAPDLTILERTVNGQPGLVALQDGVIVTVFAFAVAGDRIKYIWAVRNPEKLRPWTAG